MKTIFTTLLCTILSISTFAQSQDLSPCSHDAITNRLLQQNPYALEGILENENFIKEFISEMNSSTSNESKYQSSFVIPVVMHVFHYGDLGKMDMEQALSGLARLNEDFNGLNDGWGTIDPAFDSIKGTLDINFCLAQIDPNGSPTTGLIYHEDSLAVYNEGNLFEHAWDNRQYLNIYFPKYTSGGPSNFTAYAYYPSDSNVAQNRDGIFYSSIRWGFGNHSELSNDQDWASVCTHEAGHWLDLRHTFEDGCSGQGDLVDDTPPTQGSGIELQGCNNNDFSCGEHTNGENYMDYNHDCKKMFTQGQIDRMYAALFLSSRSNLWSAENLELTGCSGAFTNTNEQEDQKQISVYPNPANQTITINFNDAVSEILIYNIDGFLFTQAKVNSKNYSQDISNFPSGIYLFKALNGQHFKTGKFVVE